MIRFAFDSQLWTNLIENFQKSTCSSASTTLQWMSSCCCHAGQVVKFIQYIANKPDKFGLKFWLAVGVEKKFFSTGFLM